MEYTVKALADLAGVTPRTLRWYDRIGLLKPLRTTEAGYRLYGPAQLDRLRVEANETAFGQEIREKYGDEEMDRANACVLALTQEEYAQWKSLGGEIHTALVTAVKAGADPAGPEGQRIAALHRRWLSYSWESYTPQAHVGLAELYVSDPRFTAYYDREVPGCAAFLRDAVRTYTGA